MIWYYSDRGFRNNSSIYLNKKEILRVVLLNYQTVDLDICDVIIYKTL